MMRFVYTFSWMIIYVLLWHFGLLFLFIYSFGTCSVFEGCRFRGVFWGGWERLCQGKT